MRALLVHGGAIVSGALVTHGLLLFVSLWAYPPLSNVDTQHFRKSFFHSQVRSVVYGSLETARGPRDATYIVGASNATSGFRPEELKAIVPEVTFHNVTLGASNISQMIEVAQHVLVCRNDRLTSGRTVVIAALWYGVFRETSQGSRECRIFGRVLKNLSQEIDRTKVVRPVLSNNRLNQIAPGLLYVIRPFLLIEKGRILIFDYYTRQVLPSIELYKATGSIEPSMHILKQRVQQPDYLISERVARQRVMEAQAKHGNRRNRMSRFDDSLAWEQFKELERLADVVGESGAKLIIVDCPVPARQREPNPFYRDYKKKLLPTIANIQAKHNIVYLELSEMESDFFDATHPQDWATREWSEAIAPAIRAVFDLPQHDLDGLSP